MRVAIITAFTPDFLDQFKLFISSLRIFSKIPVIAVICDDDKKISVGAKYKCNEERLDPDVINEYKQIGERWIQWHKPDIIQKMSAKHHLDIVLWLDVDIIVLQDISPILTNILKSFTVIEDYFAPSTTLNNPKLYDHYPSNNDTPERALNSGVVGLALPRDSYILDEWNKRSQLVAANPHLKEYISLYDQGTLIWAMKELDVLNLVIDKPAWNHAPKRHAYEALPNPAWPFGHKTMGGDLFAEIRYDNPEAILAHFAGYPKITDLLIFNNMRSVNYASHYGVSHKIANKHVFVVGLERAGTHTLAEIIRRSVKHPSWVRHEASTKDDYLNNALSQAAYIKYRQSSLDYKEIIHKRIGHYLRKDVNIVCDSNHRLGFFIDEIKSEIPDAKFILLLRSPLQLIKSRLANFSLWPAQINKCPLEYQLELFGIHTHFNDAIGSYGQNLYRIFPKDLEHIDLWQADIIQMHVWEIVTTIQVIMDQLSQISKSDYQIIWIDNLPLEIKKMRSLINEHYLKYQEVQRLSSHKFGISLTMPNAVSKWIDDSIDSGYNYILSEFDRVLSKYNIDYCNNRTII